jgi:hypothetical protein
LARFVAVFVAALRVFGGGFRVVRGVIVVRRRVLRVVVIGSPGAAGSTDAARVSGALGGVLGRAVD